MFAFYGCLLVFISSGFSFPEPLPWNSNHTRLSARGNNYVASVGFELANIKDYPYLASITFESQFVGMTAGGAGAILNKHWVLSTGFHSAIPPPYVKISVGTNYAGRSGQQRMRVVKSIAHKKFKLDHSLSYNIALLKTDKPIIFSDKVKPVKVGNSVPNAGTDCTLLGFAYVQDGPYIGWDLGVATVKVNPQAQCNQQYNETLQTAFYAEAGGAIPCIGDVGDLLMYKNKLVGLYVVGDYCNRHNTAELYTNVPATKKWIWKTIRANSKDDEMEGIFEENLIIFM